MQEIEAFPGGGELAEGAAAYLVSCAHQAIEERGIFNLALAGGSTPARLYSLLAQSPYSQKLDWQKVHVFWGDERCVPPENEESNYHMAAQALLDHAALPEKNIHRILGELPAGQAAGIYESELQTYFGSGHLPRFDLVLLGLGEDGHTASLFPGAPALLERDHWTAAVEHNQPPPPCVGRVTLTLPVLNAAALVIFLVSGASKRKILAQVLENPRLDDVLPAQCIQPENGRLIWMVDQCVLGKE